MTVMVLFIGLGFVCAQQQTGSIRGIVMDDEGNVFPGVKVIASSPYMMGKKTYVTKHTGIFQFATLPPGTYKITTEMTGFKTRHRENVAIRAGMIVELKLIMEMAPIDEKITVTEAFPVVDVEQSKLSVSMDQHLLRNAPFARDLYDIVNFAPGAISEEDPIKRTTSIHGATVRENTYSFDGVNMIDPATMYVLTNINFDVMEEIEMVTAAFPASAGFTSGAYINVVTRSGGNDLSGGGVIYYTNNKMAKNLWIDEEVESLGLSQPSVDKNWVDVSFNLGGLSLKTDCGLSPIFASYSSQKLWTSSLIQIIEEDGMRIMTGSTRRNWGSLSFPPRLNLTSSSPECSTMWNGIVLCMRSPVTTTL